MPALTEEEIRARIADGAISAVSIDTSIFDRYGCNLQYASLRKLDQFKGGQLRVLLSDVVSEEVTSHISRDAAETQRALKRAIRTHATRWGLTDDDAAPPQAFKLDIHPREAAEQQFADFVAAVGAEVITSTQPGAVAPEVIRRYFASEPPFGDNEKKKHEFPDAFALVALEAWAEREQRQILCVSADQGWRKYASTSERLICMDDIDRALSLFNEVGRIVAEMAIRMLKSGAAPTVLKEVESALEYRLDDSDFDVDAHSSVAYEAEPLGAAVQFVDIEGATSPIVIAADEDAVTFTVKLKAMVRFEAKFSYYVQDSVDRDYVDLGAEDEYVERSVEFEVAFTVSRDFANELEVLEIQVAKQRLTIDFGYVEPFRREDPTREKY